MWNAVKMDLLRMSKTKSMFVIWIIMSAVLLLTSYLTAWDLKEMEKDDASSRIAEEEIETEPETLNVGMSVMVPTQVGDKVTVLDMCYANMNAKAIALFMVIFAVLFSTADFGSGYIKNIGGQIMRRSHLIVSKAVALFVYTICTMVLMVLVQALSNLVFLGYVKMGEPGDFLKYMAVGALLHYALLLICMALAIVLRNNVVSIILVVCLCMNVMVIFYSAVDKALAKIGIENFNLVKYTVTGKLSLLSMSPTNAACAGAVATAIGFGAVMFAISCFTFSKRDL